MRLQSLSRLSMSRDVVSNESREVTPESQRCLPLINLPPRVNDANKIVREYLSECPIPRRPDIPQDVRTKRLVQDRPPMLVLIIE